MQERNLLETSKEVKEITDREIIGVDNNYKPVGTVAKCDNCGFEYLKTRSPLIKYRVKVNQKGKVVEKNYLCRDCYNKLKGV